jgi:hypothetical protein
MNQRLSGRIIRRRAVRQREVALPAEIRLQHVPIVVA